MRTLFPLLFVLGGCAAHARPPANLAEVPCAAPRAAIRDATYTDAALEAVRDALTCFHGMARPPADIEAVIEGELRRNPYPAATRTDVHGWFFDTELLGELPGDPSALSQAAQILEDQGLARSAMGQADVARAARDRAERIRDLARVIERLDG